MKGLKDIFCISAYLARISRERKEKYENKENSTTAS
jgi:hypothetical protein